MSRSIIKVWREKPTLLMATSPGGRGGATVLQAAVSYFPFLGAQIVADYSLPSFFDNFFDDDNSNEDLREELIQKVELFKQHVNIH